jgi:hypothetical protein
MPVSIRPHATRLSLFITLMLVMVAPRDTSVFRLGYSESGEQRKSVQNIDGEALEGLFQDFDAN